MQSQYMTLPEKANTAHSIELALHDHSKVVLQKTKSGTIFLEVLRPQTLKDGHGFCLAGSALLDEKQSAAIRALLANEGDL